MIQSSAPRVAFQGVAGAFSEEAALAFAPDGVAVGFPSFDEAFDAAVGGECDFACLPVENSLAGSINQTYDLLTDSVLTVIAERIVRVHHNLLVLPGTRLEDVKRVYSHTQALQQCQRFIRQHGLEAVTDFDTAGAAKLLAERGNSARASGGADSGAAVNDGAAIASRRAAEAYGLEIAAEHIEDLTFNYTRFFVLGHEERAKQPGRTHKTSMVLATHHRPGDLVACLQVFPEHDINMTKLESRPRRDKPWSYLFYIDIEGHISDPAVAAAMTGLMRRAAFVKYLGSYPAAEPVVVE
ncbi:MAG TPA: prephenate dehydratase [Trueperaceae bacterium]|nr:prephenate dehydratase [Trueperaceae bacterium]